MQNHKLCLKWNNHTSNLLALLGGFQQKDLLVDVTISCQGQSIKAHKLILSACSPYFQNIFFENPCQHPIIIINGMKFEDVSAILNFMYKGEVNVTQDGLSSFLQAAEALKVKGLAEVYDKNVNAISKEAQKHELNHSIKDTPSRKRPRNRKRSLSDSNKSEDEGSSRKQLREPSPEVHELSGDESFTGDNSSNGPPFNSVPRVPQTAFSRSQQSHPSSNMTTEDDDYEVEPSKMLEQSLTSESNVSLNNSNPDNNLRIERIMGNATEMESSSLQEPESPPDIKPIISYGESSAGPSDGTMMLYNEQSQPGPSNMQDGLLHDNSQAPDIHFIGSFKKRCANNTANHCCETTRLLRELKEDPVCLSHLNDNNFNEDLNENPLNFAQKSNTKSPKRSKQLIIYNEEGCMKGIEINKEVSIDSSSSLLDFELSNDISLKDAYVSIQNVLECDSHEYSNFSSIQSNNGIINEQKHNTGTSDCGTRINVEQYAVTRTVKTKKRKKRGWKKGRPRKKNNSTAGINIQSETPYTTVLKQKSYTEVSVEKVHLAESKNPVHRPRRNVTKKTASEMLMLKKKIHKQIVQSTSIEYQPAHVHNYHSNINKEMDFNINKNFGQRENISKQSKGRQLVRKRVSRQPSELEKYGPELLPIGWNTEVVTRKTGKTAGQIDVYFITPEKKRLRSKAEVAEYIEKNNLPYSPEEFCFRKKAYQMLMLKNNPDKV